MPGTTGCTCSPEQPGSDKRDGHRRLGVGRRHQERRVGGATRLGPRGHVGALHHGRRGLPGGKRDPRQRGHPGGQATHHAGQGALRLDHLGPARVEAGRPWIPVEDATRRTVVDEEQHDPLVTGRGRGHLPRDAHIGPGAQSGAGGRGGGGRRRKTGDGGVRVRRRGRGVSSSSWWMGRRCCTPRRGQSARRRRGQPSNASTCREGSPAAGGNRGPAGPWARTADPISCCYPMWCCQPCRSSS